jgi:hypothetical protein
MTEYVIFKTDSEIDPIAFTTFGVTAKPNTDSPIGYFGTGLKYAIAVLLRNDAQVYIDIGKTRWSFYKDKRDFRGQEIERICWLVGQKRLGELPFTTDLGKNWDFWQAYRELESNTRDENGTTTVGPLSTPTEGVTRMYIDHPEMIKLHSSKGKVFLDQSLTRRAESEGVEFYSGQSSYLYYRGIRCMTLPRPSIYTYNITKFLPLTEDRTPGSEYTVKRYISEAVMKLKDPDLIQIIITANENKTFEGTLSFDDYYLSGDVFTKTVQESVSHDGYVMAQVKSFFNRYMIESSEERRVMLMMKESEWKEIWGLVEGEPNASVDAFRSQLNMERIKV